MTFVHEKRRGSENEGGRWLSEDGRYVIWEEGGTWTGAEVIPPADWHILFSGALSREDAEDRCALHAIPPAPDRPFGRPWTRENAEARRTEAIRRIEIAKNEIDLVAAIVENINAHPDIDDLVATLGMAGPILSDAIDGLGGIDIGDLFGDNA